MKTESQKYRKANYRTIITSERLSDLKRKYGETIGEELKQDFICMCEGKPTKLNLRTLRELGVLDIYKKFSRVTPNITKTFNIDLEPLWINLIPILLEMPKDYALKELNKLAIIGDEVRQAQKKKQKLVYDFSEVEK